VELTVAIRFASISYGGWGAGPELLRLDSWQAGLLPAVRTALQNADILEAHVLEELGGERPLPAPAAGRDDRSVTVLQLGIAHRLGHLLVRPDGQRSQGDVQRAR